MIDLPGRPDFWNIGYPLFGAIVYLAIPISLGVISYGIIRRIKLWKIGLGKSEKLHLDKRIYRFVRELMFGVVTHKNFIRKKHVYPGIMHFLIFWGFSILFIATVVAALEFNFYRYFGVMFPTAYIRVEMGFIWDIFGGVLASIGVGMAAWRRYVIRPPRLNTMLDDSFILVTLIALLASGFVLEGLRIASTELNPSSYLYSPSSALWSPVGWVIAKSLIFSGIPNTLLELSHKFFWWSHAGIFTIAIVYAAVKFSQIFHMIISPLNIFFRTFRKSGELKNMESFESLESFGARSLKDFSWRELMAFDACTNCGRCQEVCPAWQTKKPLSPRKVIQDMRKHMENQPLEKTFKSPIANTVISEEVVWSCLTCGACIDICPVKINQVDTIIDIRRFLTLEEASLPKPAQSALNNIEQRGHPWVGTEHDRLSWMDGLDVKIFADYPETEILFWVGCTGSMTDRGIETTKSMVSVLNKAGIDFAVLGGEESCTGDPARRMGNEYLFQVQAKKNIVTLDKFNIKKIITTCPHCFNTIKNEYPQLGGSYQIEHYTSFVNKLVQTGKLNPHALLEQKKITYHDSCYLGRHNGLISEPRKIISSIPNLNFVEIQNNKDQGFCCGAGGGRMWMEESGQKVNHKRVDDFLKTDADTMVVSCGFCIQMMEEGISAAGQSDKKNAIDLLTLIDKST